MYRGHRSFFTLNIRIAMSCSRLFLNVDSLANFSNSSGVGSRFPIINCSQGSFLNSLQFPVIRSSTKIPNAMTIRQLWQYSTLIYNTFDPDRE